MATATLRWSSASRLVSRSTGSSQYQSISRSGRRPQGAGRFVCAHLSAVFRFRGVGLQRTPAHPPLRRTQMSPFRRSVALGFVAALALAAVPASAQLAGKPKEIRIDLLSFTSEDGNTTFDAVFPGMLSLAIYMNDR